MRHGCRRFLLAGTDDDDRWCGEDVCRPKTNILEFILILILLKWNLRYYIHSMFSVYFALPSFTITFNLSPPPSTVRWGEKLLIEDECVRVCKKLHHTRMEERWIWTRANSSTIRPQLKYWLWRILIQKYYVCFSLTLAFASNTTTRRIFFLVSTNEHSHFIFVLSREFLFFKQVKWNISLSHAHTLFFHLIFMIFFWDTLFFHCNWLHIKNAGNHQLKSLRSDACKKWEERTANWSIN